MATTTRTTVWSSGNTLTAAALNAEFNNLLNALALGDSDVSGGIAASKISGTAVTLSGNQTVTGQKTFNTGTLRPTDIVDSNGNELVKFSTTASAVDEITVTNATANGIPQISATGDDTDIDIDIRGKNNGLVRISVIRQDDTVNTYRHGTVILTGWGYIAGNTGSAIVSEGVTFGITFTEKPVVVASWLGDLTGAPVDIGTFNNLPTGAMAMAFPFQIGAGSFTMEIAQTDSGNFASTNNQGYSWIAIGTF